MRIFRFMLMGLVLPAGLTAQEEVEHHAPTPRVDGIGGIYLYAENADSLASWYREMIGIECQKHGELYSYTFRYRLDEFPDVEANTIWVIIPVSRSLSGSRKTIISYRIRHLDGLVEKLKASGVQIIKSGEFGTGRFVRIADPEGNELELFEDRIETEEKPDY